MTGKNTAAEFRGCSLAGVDYRRGRARDFGLSFFFFHSTPSSVTQRTCFFFFLFNDINLFFASLDDDSYGAGNRWTRPASRFRSWARRSAVSVTDATWEWECPSTVTRWWWASPWRTPQCNSSKKIKNRDVGLPPHTRWNQLTAPPGKTHPLARKLFASGGT